MDDSISSPRTWLVKGETIKITEEQVTTSVFILQVPPTSPRWQKGPHGGKHSCQRERAEARTLNQILTLLHNSKRNRKNPLLQPPRHLATRTHPSRRPARVPASSATKPLMTPNWSRSSMSRHVAEIWKCHAQVDSKRRGGCAPLFLSRRKRQRRGRRTYGDNEEDKRAIKDWFTKMLEKNEWDLNRWRSFILMRPVCCTECW